LNKSTLVVKSQMPRRARLFAAIAGIASVVAGFMLYDLGQQSAGHNSVEARRVAATLEDEIERTSKENRALREQMAALETATKIDSEAYARVEQELVDLQAQIIQQQEDLAFYRGIVDSGGDQGLRIQDFRVSRGSGAAAYVLRLVLAQSIAGDKKVSGVVDLSVEGQRDGETVRLDLADLNRDEATGANLPFSFRYFQNLKAGLILPEDFSPERVLIRVRPKGKSAKTVEEFFAWDLKPG